MVIKRNARIIAMVCALIMFVAVFAGCKNSNSGTTDSTGTSSLQTESGSTIAAGTTNDIEPITFEWFSDEAQYLSFVQTWGNDAVSKYITKKTGVNINFIIPASDGKMKFQTMVASDSLPDIITCSTDSIKSFATSQLYDLPELSAKYDSEFLNLADPDVLKYNQASDGKTYYYPNYPLSSSQIETNKNTLNPSFSNEIFVVREDIYNAIGKPDMTTPDGFIDALAAAKEKFPTVNGKPLITFGIEPGQTIQGGLAGTLLHFVGVPDQIDGKIVDKIQDPEAVLWYKTLRKAASMNLITSNFFTDNYQQYNENQLNGVYFAVMGCYSANNQQAWNNGIHYIPVDGPKSTQGNPYQLTPTAGLYGWKGTAITKNCKDPKRALEFISYWLSDEGQKDFYLGEKGVTYDTIDGKDQFLPEVLNELINDPDTATNKYGTMISYPFYDILCQAYGSAFVSMQPAPIEPMSLYMQWSKDKLFPRDLFQNVNPTSDSPEGVILSKRTELQDQIFPKLIFAKSDEEFDTIFAEYVKKASDLGQQKLLDAQTKVYEKNLKMMGK